MDRWILSFGIDCARAAITAARSRAFASGSGKPILAATVISRLSFENSAERFLSCAPFRYMMFLYLEWPAMALSLREPEGRAIGLHQCVGFLTGMRLHLPQPDDGAHRLGVIAVRLRLCVDVANVVGDALLLFFQALDALDE